VNRSQKKKPALYAIAFGVLAAAAPVVYAVCYPEVTIYWADGTSQECSYFCTFSGGWLCS
jgi:hypothetical protein